MTHYLRIDSSARHDGSVSRSLADLYFKGMPDVYITHRDVSAGLPCVDNHWVTANFTPAEERTTEQHGILSLSDSLIAEIKAAETIIITTPIYNFGIPSTLKAWIDQICRVGETFHYTSDGPVGNLIGRNAVIFVASGGTPAGSAMDFVTPYLTHVLNFIGIDEVRIIAADGSKRTGQNLERAKAEIKALKAA